MGVEVVVHLAVLALWILQQQNKRKLVQCVCNLPTQTTETAYGTLKQARDEGQEQGT